MAALLCKMCCRTLLCTRYRGRQLLGIRHLLSDEYCKYKEFLKEKQDTTLFFYKVKDTLFETIQAKLENSESISKRELKAMMYLCETESEVQLLKKCLLRHYENAGNTEYIFGPLFLRLCYSLGLVDTAFEMLKEKSSRRMISNYTSFNIMVDILYKHGQYERGLAVLQEMKAQGYTFHKNTYILAFAICYQLDDLHTLNTFFQEAVTNKTALPRLALCFAVALNLKKEEYVQAMNCYDEIVNKNTSICNNLNFLLAAKFDQEEKMLQILETASNCPRLDFLRKVTFSKDVVDVAEKKLQPTDSCKKLYELYDKLKHSGQISTLTLDEMLHASQVYDQQTS